MKGRPVIVLGGGGHAKVLLDILSLEGTEILGIAAPTSDSVDPGIRHYPWLGDDSTIKERYSNADILVINGVGYTGGSAIRRRIFFDFRFAGFSFGQVIHPSVILAKDAVIHEGVQIMAGAIIQPSVSIGVNSIVNTRVSIDHDCLIGDHVHLAPGVVLSGGVTVEDGVFVGAGAVAIPQVRIRANSIVGAGAVITRDIPPNKTYAGVPAKELKK